MPTSLRARLLARGRAKIWRPRWAILVMMAAFGSLAWRWCVRAFLNGAWASAAFFTFAPVPASPLTPHRLPAAAPLLLLSCQSDAAVHCVAAGLSAGHPFKEAELSDLQLLVRSGWDLSMIGFSLMSVPYLSVHLPLRMCF